MAQILSQQLGNLSLDNKQTQLSYEKAVLYADYKRDQYTILLKSIHYYEEVYFEYGWHHVDDIKLEFVYNNELSKVNFFFEDEPNILAWPYDFASNITIYNIVEAGKLEDVGCIYFHPNLNIFMPPCPGQIEIYSDPIYHKRQRCPLTIQR